MMGYWVRAGSTLKRERWWYTRVRWYGVSITGWISAVLVEPH